MKKNILKIIVVAFAATLAFCVRAEEELFSLENRADGFSYISIDSNVSAFTLNVEQIGRSCAFGGAGYFTYTADMAPGEMAAYIKENGKDFADGTGTYEAGELEAGTRVGFYSYKPHHGFSWYGFRYDEKLLDDTFSFKTKLVQYSLDWRGNVVSEKILDEGTFIDFSSYAEGGWMKISIAAKPAGAPLPGAMAMLLVGMAGVGGLKASERKKKKLA